MKTRTATFFVLILVATCSLALHDQQHNTPTALHPAVVNEMAAGKNTIVKKASLPQLFITYLADRTSFFRSFMPYATDPCNHLPSQKTFC